MTETRWRRMVQGWRDATCGRRPQPSLLGLTALAALALAGCTATREPRISHGGPPGQQTMLINGQAAKPDAEADRLIAALNLSDGMREVARDFVAIEMAKGIPARAAVANWVSIQRGQGVVVRCTRIASNAVECVAR